MNLTKHENLLKLVDLSKKELLEQVKKKIADIGVKQASLETRKKMQYMNDVKSGRAPVSYVNLIEMARKLLC